MRKIFGVMVVVLLAGCREYATGLSTFTNSPILKYTDTYTRTTTSTGMPITKKTPFSTTFPFATPLDGWLMEISPNGEWGVWNIPVGVCGDKLIIMNILDESLTWELGYLATFEITGTIDLAVYPEHWSIDGQFLYFNVDIGCVNGGPAFQGVLYLKRLNLATGKIIDVLPSGKINAKISPNSQFLAYLKGNQINIRDLSTSKEKSLSIVIADEFSRGDVHWSPDSTKLVFNVETHDDDFSKFMFTLVFIDIIKMEHKILIKEFQEKDWNYWIVWEDNETLTLSIPSKTKLTILSINTTTSEVTEVEE